MIIKRRKNTPVLEVTEDPRLVGDEDAPRPEEKRGERFFGYIYLIIGLLGIALVSRLFYLSIVQGKKNVALAEGNRVQEQVIRAPRGLILDRKGRIIARNEANYELTIIPGDLPKNQEERDALYLKLSLLLALPTEEIKSKAESKGLELFRRVLIAERIDRDKALNLETQITNLRGVRVEINPIRQYVGPSSLSHILGYVGRLDAEEAKINPDYLLTDFIGKEGIEKQYERKLKGKNGARIVEVDALGHTVRTIGPPREPVAGEPIRLTIDLKIQQAAEAALKKQLKAARKTKGSAVVMNPINGEVLAMVSLPAYNNNLFAKGISAKEYTKLIKNPDRPLFFRAVLGTYPSGSTIKPFMASIGLQERIITPQTTVRSTGGLKVNKNLYPDWRPGGHGTVSLNKAIADSVNTYFYILGGGLWDQKGTEVIKRGLGIIKIKKYLSLFGFGENTGIDLPQESKGLIPDPEWKLANKPYDCMKGATAWECWYLGDTYNLSIGQGDVAISPLQMATGLSSIANGGKLIAPHLNSANKPVVTRSGFISAQNLSYIRGAMRSTVTSGSGRALSGLPLAIAGKTGTAQFGGDNKKEHAWFVSFAPYEKPKVVVVAMVEGAGEGHQYALPIARDIYRYIIGKRILDTIK